MATTGEAIIGMKSSLHNFLSVGTGEKALYNAVHNTFTNATHLRCFKHVKDNVEEKLRRDLNIADEGVRQILNDIFGYKDDVYHFLVWCMLQVRMISMTNSLH